MTTQKQIKGNIGLLEQCESFKLVSSVDGFTTYHGFSFDDEIIELVFCVSQSILVLLMALI